ncbi:MAG: flavodoxin family protein [Epulopiscium sp.]|nr:flavodoxin family protein [Candidatus Epulonipiscium sp.]
MKTLVFFGAARRKGHTKAMVDLLIEHLDGEVEIIDAYREPVKPCIDCRYCWRVNGCSIKDDMQDIYKKIEEADNVVFASPIYFHSITGPLKTMIDRLQVYWAAHVRKDKPEGFQRKGAMLLVGGAPDFEDQFLGGDIVLRNVFNDINAENLGMVTLANSDVDSIDSRPEVKEEIIALAKKMNEANK